MQGQTSGKGFTLFEVLVTISVIVIVVSMSMFGLRSGKDARQLDRGIDMLHSMVRIARTQAITNGVNARLIVNLDTSDKEGYLRQLGVVIEDPSEEGYWKAVERGNILPLGVYVVPSVGSESIPKAWFKSEYRVSKVDTSDALFRYDYPTAKREIETNENGKLWFAIQFEPNGRLGRAEWGGGGQAPTSNHILLAVGVLTEEGEVEFLEESLALAVKFKPTGNTYEIGIEELKDIESE